ncbi:F0F1 ATP synthase subunit A [Candidatus Oscillochloris fontis]|uniref:F0F1 ATP synthase subunit A n=1 Tax=Candidatus Oscillochloris fontis TaxID=2496868 RepID=UPI001EE8E7E1|nr:FoF1 ATP synthase subunit a [Candidatus Oscillochloris fontis]
MRNRILTVLGVLAVVGVVMYFLGFRMTKEDLHISAAAEPLFCIGGTIEGEHCSAGTILPFTNAVLMTLLVDAILVGIAFGIGQRLQMVPRGFQNIIELLIEFFYDFVRGVDKKNVAKFFALPMTIFLFFLFGNMLALVPGVGSIGVCRPYAAEESHNTEATEGSHSTEAATEEHGSGTIVDLATFPGACDHNGNLMVPFLRAPAADLNVTFAFAIVAVFMVEFWGFQALGIGYLGKFFINPAKEGVIMTVVGLLELFSEIMRIIAFAFRIFGNIFGGEVVLAVMIFLFSYLLPLPFYGLEVFVAFIQAVIFAVLTVVFAALAVQAHGGDHGDDHSHAGNEAKAH